MMNKQYRVKNGYYLKDKKCEVFAKVSSRDIAGIETSYYKPISTSPFWCYTRQVNATIEFLARTHGIDEKRLFVFNYNPLISVYHFIRYGGKWFQITRVDREDDYNGDIFVYVKDYRTPKADEIKTFD